MASTSSTMQCRLFGEGLHGPPHCITPLDGGGPPPSSKTPLQCVPTICAKVYNAKAHEERTMVLVRAGGVVVVDIPLMG